MICPHCKRQHEAQDFLLHYDGACVAPRDGQRWNETRTTKPDWQPHDHAHREDFNSDPLAVPRGIVNALLLSIPLWIAIAGIVWVVMATR